MKAMSSAGLAVLLAVGVTLFASPPAWAGKAVDIWGAHELTNMTTEPDPDAGARGVANLTDVVCTSYWLKYDGSKGACYTAVLTVTCRRLTPGQKYWTPVGTFTADRHGRGEVRGQVDFCEFFDWWWGFQGGLMVDVVRPDANGTVVLHTEWY